MLNLYVNIQTSISSIFLPLEGLSNIIFFWMMSYVQYLNNYFLIDTLFLKYVSHLLIAWFNPFNLDSLYNYTICDKIAYIWLWHNGNIAEWVLWSAYNYFFQMERTMAFLISPVYIGFKNLLLVKINLYIYNIIVTVLKCIFFFIFFFNLLFYTRFNVSIMRWGSSSIVSKFFILFEGEEELGSLDDGVFFITLFIFIFSWYFLISYFFINNFNMSLIYLTGGFVILVCFVLLIPFSTVLDFGLAFASYIRGAGSSSNFIVEAIFDSIGTFVVFIRFVVQNIRFVLIFGAYVELFESIYNSPFLAIFQYLFTFNSNNFFYYSFLDFTNIFYLISIIIFGIIGYLYYFVHLLILLFIQLGAYFLISFWLFFFFYTSFVLNKYERVFFFKKYLV